MPVVFVIDVITVGNGDVSAVHPVLMLVALVRGVCGVHAIVHMVPVYTVKVPFVRVVGVVMMWKRYVPATRTMLVGVGRYGLVRRSGGHLAASFAVVLSGRRRPRLPRDATGGYRAFPP